MCLTMSQQFGSLNSHPKLPTPKQATRIIEFRQTCHTFVVFARSTGLPGSAGLFAPAIGATGFKASQSPVVSQASRENLPTLW